MSGRLRDEKMEKKREDLRDWEWVLERKKI